MKRCVVSSLLAIVIALCMPLVLAAKMSDEAFLELCKTGSVAQIQKAIRSGSDVNASDEWGSTPLHEAAWHNSNPDVLNVLLKAGANVNATTSSFVTPLHLAAGNNANPEITALLLKAGADVNALNKWGNSPLHDAAQTNPNLEVLKALLKAGAEVNAENDEGSIPLHDAVRLNTNPDVVMALLKAEADVDAVDGENKRPVDYADSNKHLKGTEAYRHLYELSNGVGREKKMARPKYKIVAEEKNYEQYIVKFYNENIQVMHKLENTLERGSWTMTWDPGLGPLPFAVIFSGFFKNTEGVMRKIMLIFSVYPDKDNTDIRRIRHAFDGDAFFREGLPAWLEYEIMN